jgi:hypothetical protein
MRTIAILAALLPVLWPRTARADEVRLDPIADPIAIGAGALAAGAVALIAGTGKIRPTRPGDPDDLFFLDRPQTHGTLGATTDSLATASDYVWYSTLGVAVLWPIVTGLEHGNEDGWVDLALYVETVALTGGITQLVRITTLRPRPSSYILTRQGNYDPATAGTSTSMSFFSGHMATVPAVGATMTYLEFLRNPRTARPWISLGFWTAATVGMSYLRVSSKRHFVTDSLVSVLVGSVIGTLVPHLHRVQTPVMLTASADREGGTVGVAAEW